MRMVGQDRSTPSGDARVLISPLPTSQVLSQLPMAPDPGETLFLAEQPPLPPPPLLPPSLASGSIVPTAKPAPTLIKVFSASGCPPFPGI